MLPLIIISALGGIIASVACTAITVAIEGYLDSKKVKDMQKNGVLGSAIRCAVKTKNSVTFEDLEKGKKYEVSCDGGVSDDISEGKKFILEVV